MASLQAEYPTNRFAILDKGESCFSSPQCADRIWGTPKLSYDELTRPKLKAAHSYRSVAAIAPLPILLLDDD